MYKNSFELFLKGKSIDNTEFNEYFVKKYSNLIIICSQNEAHSDIMILFIKIYLLKGRCNYGEGIGTSPNREC